jgi:hypothetical protein
MLARVLECTECGAVSDEEATAWRAYLGLEEDDTTEVTFVFCLDCAEREFGLAGREAN